MAIQIISRKQLAQTENIAVGIFQEKVLKNIPQPLQAEIKKVITLGDVTGKAEEILVLYPAGRFPRRIILYGLGKKEELHLDKIRKASALILKKAVALKLRTLVLDIESFNNQKIPFQDIAEAVTLGSFLSVYKFNEFKPARKPADKIVVPKIALACQNLSECAPAAQRGATIAEAVNYSRTLANRPANKLFPEALAQEAKQLAKKYAKISVKILRKQELIRKGFNALLAVGSGSVHPPVLIELKYQGRKNRQAPIALVGKGITFDSGGISLKPSAKMDEMRYDMSGAATVLGIFKAAAQLKLPVNLLGIIPAAENMPSGSAAHPGDIVTSLSGQTIEILNTDAEGRLVLADGLTYTKRYNPACIIDFATLTGAVIVALGHVATGVVTNNQPLIEEIKQAAEVSGEKVWQLPLWDEYRDLIKSEVADIANIGNKPDAGTIVGAAFLEKFVDKTPWVHMDIAGTAWVGASPIFSKGATGVGVRLILEWLQKKKQISSSAKR